MQTKGFAYKLQGSVPGAGLALNLVFRKQTLSIVRGWSVLVKRSKTISFRIKYLQNYESNLESKIRGDVSM